MSVIKPVTIERRSAVDLREAYDYAALRQQAVELLQQMAGDSWTDYNLHDPGVTITEQLCYAITDLAFRTNFPIKDLLADESGTLNYSHNSFFSREDILISRPVTTNDFRKVLIDRVKEIDNIWLTPVYSAHSPESIKGIYRATAQLSREVARASSSDDSVIQQVKKRIRSVFTSERNLGEDLADEIRILKPVYIRIQADIIIDDNAEPEKVLAEIYYSLQQTLTNKVTYSTEDELIHAGLSPEEIFSGPRLMNGFIPEHELKPMKEYIDTIDIGQIISRTEGVSQVRIVTIGETGGTLSNKPFKIDNESFPFLDESTASAIKLSTSTSQVQIKPVVFHNLFLKVAATRNRAFVTTFLKDPSKELSTQGKKNSYYYSIQHTFPQTYGISANGLPTSERTETRKGQVKQLKAYLLLFEQVLANYLANLTHVSDYFSSAPPLQGETMNHFKPVFDIPDLGNLLKSYTELYGDETTRENWDKFTDDSENGYIKHLYKLADEEGEYSKTKCAQLDHMLARFNVVLYDYPVKLSKQLYRPEKKENKFSEELKWRRYYLNRILEIQQGETRGFDYTNNPLPPFSFNFERKIRLLLYISGQNGLIPLSSVFDQGQLIFESVKEMPVHYKQPLAAENQRWVQDNAKLFISAEASTELFSNRLNKRAIKEKEFNFPGRGNRLFAEAISYSNYKIIPEAASVGSFLIIFKYPADRNWDMISRHSSEEDAIFMLKKLVNFFRTLSIESEGFYLLDHILLRPALHTESYAYMLTDTENQIAERSGWMTFYKRETELFNKVKTNSGKNLKIALLAKGPDEQAIDESIFNFQLTLVLPCWPARFQDPNFKEYIREVVSVNLPANINLTLRWLTPSKMSLFESDYLDWKRSYAGEDAERMDLKHKLISFLLNK